MNLRALRHASGYWQCSTPSRFDRLVSQYPRYEVAPPQLPFFLWQLFASARTMPRPSSLCHDSSLQVDQNDATSIADLGVMVRLSDDWLASSVASPPSTAQPSCGASAPHKAMTAARPVRVTRVLNFIMDVTFGFLGNGDRPSPEIWSIIHADGWPPPRRKTG